MKFNIKDIQLILEDPRIVLSVFIGSILILLMNLIPVDILNKFSILNWLPTINHIVFFMLLISLFVGLYHIIVYIHKKYIEYEENKKSKEKIEEIKQAQEELFNNKDAMKVLKKIYDSHPDAEYLCIHNQKVLLLEQYFLIKRTTEEVYRNKFAPYVLQPVAEKRLNEVYENKATKE